MFQCLMRRRVAGFLRCKFGATFLSNKNSNRKTSNTMETSGPFLHISIRTRHGVVNLCVCWYAPNNALKIGFEAAFLLNVNLTQRVSRNRKVKTVYPSSSVSAEKVDDPHLEEELNSYEFGCCGLESGAKLGSPSL